MARELTVLVGTILVMFSRPLLGSWINPVSLFVLPFISLLVGQSLFFADLPFSYTAFGVVGGCFVTFALGVFIVGSGTRVPRPYGESPPLRLRGSGTWFDQLSIALATTSWLTAGFAWYLTRVLGWGQTSGGQIFKEAFAAALQGSLYGWVYRLLQLAMYVSALLLSLGCLSGRRPPRRLSLVFIVGVLAVAYITMTRMRVLIVLLTFGAVWLIGATPRWRVLDLRRLGRVAMASLGTVALAAMILVARYRALDSLGLWFVQRFSLHAVGSPSGLSQWLDQYQGSEGFHGLVLGGVLDLIGVRSREIGAFDQVLLLPHDLGLVTNLYTGFRFFVMDFGIAGTLAVFMIIGYAAGYLYRSAVSRGSVVATGLLACVYIWCLWFPISSLSYYNFWVILCLISVLSPFLFRNSFSTTSD